MRDSEAYGALAEARHTDPFSVLGPHLVDGALVIRALHPSATAIDAVHAGRATPMARVHEGGVFEARFPDTGAVVDYRLRLRFPDGHVAELDDPYRYGRVITEYDLYLFAQGKHTRIYEKLGAHLMRVGEADGVHFAVWAPNADRVSVVGDFNMWDGRLHPMRRLGPSGVWEIFVPGLSEGQRYKFEIRSARHGEILLKADPYGLRFELPPMTASIVARRDYDWDDADWFVERAGRGAWLNRPVAIYEVHLGSWARVPEDHDRSLTYRELADRLIPYVREMGYTHVELLPVMEHPYAPSWGYQVTGFFAPTSRFGGADDFKAFVERCHQAGIGVILDWVPGHFPKDAHGLARFDGTALYEHADPRQGEHRDWGTLIFNYGRNEVRNFLLANALFWLEEYHVDGLRVDAVASMLYLDYSRSEGQWVPNKFGGRENLDAVDFLRELNALTHGEHGGSITVAEESTAFPSVSRPTYLGGLGFTYKWNMGWMNDTLEYIKKDPVFRRYHHNLLTFSLLYAFSENYILPFSHDEVVHMKGSMWGKAPGEDWQKAATLRVALRLHVRPPGQEADVHGQRVRPDARVEPRPEPRLAPARSAAARRRRSLRARPEPRLRVRAGALPVRLRVVGFPVDRLQRQRQLGRVARSQGVRPRRLPRRRLQLHAGAAPRLHHRRAGGGALPRTRQQRCGRVRRQQRRQRRRHRPRSHPGTWIRPVASPDPAAAGIPAAETGHGYRRIAIPGSS